MSLDYTGDNGLFTHLGKLVKHYNQFKVDATDPSTGLKADRDEILATFYADQQFVAVDGLPQSYQRWESEYASRREVLASFATARLLDDDVLSRVRPASKEPGEVVQKLIAAM